ncbi:putative transcription factor MYB-HB-like family [Arabidopsis thaliana]|nr:Homeodomain-like superfamily protein [Arabidopsis thaliana]AEE76190.1 Homeodomain-like superfamily protein [Arabidopsis thaliana]KAG7625782.1 Homeobox-like domain superfamily [Arabidopsis thaliana x Arabidopsis arenosa]|eukprot:NP_188537.1 Homeodomain-like superfamily protein [Arabidopsis thaliana]
MTNLDEFLEELSSIESHSQKIVKIDEHLKKLDEETKEDEDEDAAKIIQDRSTAREAEIALLMDLRQNFLPPPSMSSSSLQPPSSSTLAPSSSSSLQPPAPLIDFFRSSVSYSHQPPSSSTLATSSSPSLQPPSMSSSSLQPPASLREFFTSSVSYSHQPSSSSTLATSSFFPSSMPYSVRPPDSSDRPSLREFFPSSPSSSIQPPESSSSKRARLSNIFPSPLSSSPSPFVNPFLRPQAQEPTIPNFINPIPQISPGLPALFPNPNPNPNPNPIPNPIRNPDLVWTNRLQLVFDDAVVRLGGLFSATPKAINELISEEGLTGDQIRSHLQVLRDRQKAIADKLALE